MNINLIEAKSAFSSRLFLLLRGKEPCKAACKYCPDSDFKGETVTITDLGKYCSPISDLKEIEIIAYSYPQVITELHYLIKKIRANCKIPIILSFGPGLLIDHNELVQFKEEGLSGVCFSLVTANKNISIFRQDKNVKRWDTFRALAMASVKLWGPEKIGITVALGLGETEEQIVSLMQKAWDQGILTYLYPLLSTAEIEVSVGKLYRLLLARYLIINKETTANQMQYDDFGQLIYFGISKERFCEIVEQAVPFGAKNLYMDCCNISWQAELLQKFFSAEEKKESGEELMSKVCRVDWQEAWLTQRRNFALAGIDFDEDEIESENGSIYKMIADLGREK